jgi:hypothetical protein
MAFRMVLPGGNPFDAEDAGEYTKNSVFKSAAQSGSTDFLAVSCEKSDGSADICLVGNGPTSPANARFSEHAREDIPTLLAEVERLRAEIGRGAAPPPQTWQPIETAPKDGTLIDVWLGDGSAEDVEFYCASRRSRRSTNWHWREGKFRPFVGLGMPIVTVRPTHWMALPAPPEGERT